MEPKKLTRLLAATDGSAAGHHALQVARQLATRIGAQLEVLTVQPVGAPEFVCAGHAPQESPIAPAVRWTRGIPGLEIGHCARQWRSDLVVLGRDPRPPGSPPPLGRTTDTVIRRLESACLLIPQTVDKLERIVVATDGTRRGLGVLDPAIRIAADFGAELVVAHVVAGAPLPSEALQNEPGVRRIQSILTEQPGFRSDRLQVLQGSPVPELLALIERSGADVLMLGVRRGGPTGDLGSGHIGRDLLRTVPVAILTIPI